MVVVVVVVVVVLEFSEICYMNRNISLAYYSGVTCFREKYHLISVLVYVWSASMLASYHAIRL